MSIMEILSIMVFIVPLMFTLEELSFVENVRATTVHHKWLTDMDSIGIIGKGLSLIKAIRYLAKTRREWGVSRE